MPITTPLPTPPQSSDPANFNTRTDAFLAALPTFQTELNAYAASLAPIGRNVLLNGRFNIDQRLKGVNTSVSDDAYGIDRWNILTQTASVQCQGQIAAPEDGYSTYMRLTQNQASAQRMGFSQIVEGKHCKQLRGSAVTATLSGRIRCSSSQAIRYAVLGWTGTEDAVTSDVVSSWTNGTFTTGNFFNSTTLSLLATGSITPSAATWTAFSLAAIVTGTSFNNLIVFVWTETTAAQNVTLDCDGIQLERGSSANTVEEKMYADELAACKRYYQLIGGSGVAGQDTYGVCQVSSTTSVEWHKDIPEMRTLPTCVMNGTFKVWDNGKGTLAAASAGGTASASTRGLLRLLLSAGAPTWSNIGCGLVFDSSGTTSITADAEL